MGSRQWGVGSGECPIFNFQFPNTSNVEVKEAEASGKRKLTVDSLARRSLGGGWLTGNNTTGFVSIVPILKFV